MPSDGYAGNAGGGERSTVRHCRTVVCNELLNRGIVGRTVPQFQGNDYDNN